MEDFWQCYLTPTPLYGSQMVHIYVTLSEAASSGNFKISIIHVSIYQKKIDIKRIIRVNQN